MAAGYLYPPGFAGGLSAVDRLPTPAPSAGFGCLFGMWWGGTYGGGLPEPPSPLTFESGAGTLWRAAERIAWRQGERDRLRTGKE